VGDISLLKIEAKEPLPFAELGDSDKLEVGACVFAVGNPFLLADIAGQPTVSFGIVSAVKSYQENYFDAVWTDAAVNPGNSGGPLLQLDGKLVGINGRIEPRFMTRSNTGIGYAISANQIKRFLPFLKKAGGKAVMHAMVQGLVLQEPEQKANQFEWQNENLTRPAVVKEVKPGTTAATAGFQPGDRIVAVDDYETFNRARFFSVLGSYPGGQEVTFSLKRAEAGAAEKDVRLKLVLDGQKNIGMGCSLAMVRANLPGRGPVLGLLVTAIPGGRAAEKAGLRPRDFIVGVDGQKLESETQARTVLGELPDKYNVGDKVKLAVIRPPAVQEIEIELPLSEAFE